MHQMMKQCQQLLNIAARTESLAIKNIIWQRLIFLTLRQSNFDDEHSADLGDF